MKVFTVSSADAGDFPRGRVAWDVLHATAQHRTRLPDQIDLSGCVMLKPYAVACLAALGARAAQPIAVVLPRDQGCAEHLSRLRLGAWLKGAWDERVEARSTNIVAKQLDARPGDISGEVIRALTGGLELSANVAQLLANHLDEVLLNALTHADSPIGAIVVGQEFPGLKCLEIAVLDLGQTIRGHLTGNPKHQSIATDSEAIIRATEEGVSGTVGFNRWGDPNSGVGLFELRKYCECGGGELTILSGSQYVCFSQTSGPSVNLFRGMFQGCLVNIRFFAR